MQRFLWGVHRQECYKPYLSGTLYSTVDWECFNEPGQAGEGYHLLDGTEVNPMDLVGNYYLAVTTLSHGSGILKEKFAPYTDSNGQKDMDGDWSIPEEMRFAASFELKDANILPKENVAKRVEAYLANH